MDPKTSLLTVDINTEVRWRVSHSSTDFVYNALHTNLIDLLSLDQRETHVLSDLVVLG